MTSEDNAPQPSSEFHFSDQDASWIKALTKVFGKPIQAYTTETDPNSKLEKALYGFKVNNTPYVLLIARAPAHKDPRFLIGIYYPTVKDEKTIIDGPFYPTITSIEINPNRKSITFKEQDKIIAEICPSEDLLITK